MVRTISIKNHNYIISTKSHDNIGTINDGKDLIDGIGR